MRFVLPQNFIHQDLSKCIEEKAAAERTKIGEKKA
jgi:hypothetical protein